MAGTSSSALILKATQQVRSWSMPFLIQVVSHLQRQNRKQISSFVPFLEKIPPEVLARILSYLDDKDLLTCMQLLNFNLILVVPTLPRQLRLAANNEQFARRLFETPMTPRNAMIQRFAAQSYLESPHRIFPQQQLERIVTDSTALLQNDEAPLPNAAIQRTPMLDSQVEVLKTLLGTPLADDEKAALLQRLFFEPALITTAISIFNILVKAVKRMSNQMEGQEIWQQIAPNEFKYAAGRVFARSPALLHKLNQIPDGLVDQNIFTQLLRENRAAKAEDLFYFWYHSTLQRKNKSYDDYSAAFKEDIPDFDTLSDILTALPSDKRMFVLMIILNDHYSHWKQLFFSSKCVELILPLLPDRQIYPFLQFIQNNYPTEWQRLFNNEFTYARLQRVCSPEVMMQIHGLYQNSSIIIYASTVALEGIDFVEGVAALMRADVFNEELPDQVQVPTLSFAFYASFNLPITIGRTAVIEIGRQASLSLQTLTIFGHVSLRALNIFGQALSAIITEPQPTPAALEEAALPPPPEAAQPALAPGS